MQNLEFSKWLFCAQSYYKTVQQNANTYTQVLVKPLFTVHPLNKDPEDLSFNIKKWDESYSRYLIFGKDGKTSFGLSYYESEKERSYILENFFFTLEEIYEFYKINIEQVI